MTSRVYSPSAEWTDKRARRHYAEPLAQYDDLESCRDVTAARIASAVAPASSMNDPTPRQKSLALLRRMAEIAKPNDEAPRLLSLLAAVANLSWIDGELVVKLIGDSELTVLELLVDDGVSRERIAGPLRFDVPLAEFRAEVAARGSALAPLSPTEALSDRRVILSGKPAYAREHRKASLSAFDTSLLNKMSGRFSEQPGG